MALHKLGIFVTI